jgi:4-amino-4-deoxy-L-arabinose transferase-like glycosyltransferase
MPLHDSEKTWGMLAVGLLLFAVLFTRLWQVEANYSNSDEKISVSVVKQMYLNNSLDNNWKYADLPPHFKYDQYNFSSYHYTGLIFYSLARFIAEKTAGIAWQESYDLLSLRLLSVLFAVATAFLLWLIALRCFNSLSLAVVVLVLYAASTILIQDAHYARCESFLTFWSALVFYLASDNTVKKSGLFLIGVVIGILVSCKITMVLIILLPMLQLARYQPEKSAINPGFPALMLYVLAGLVTGLFIGMPYAFFNPGEYLIGILYLKYQYAGSTIPFDILL